MYKLNYLLSVLLMCIFFSCDKDPQLEETTSTDPLSQEEIESLIYDHLSSGEVWEWEGQSPELIWSAGMRSDSMFSVGFQPAGFTDLKNKIHEIDITDAPWQKAKSSLVDVILSNESMARGEADLSMSDLEKMGENDYFPSLFVSLSDLGTVEKLMAMPEVRYVEPLGFSLTEEKAFQRSSSGCSGSPDYGINSGDYTTVAPGAKVPWNFYNHNIPNAWNSTNQGDNIKVCIIDSGSANNQDNLRSNFNSGYSSGRTWQAHSTKYSGSWWWKSLDSPNDPCGHGTSMAGLATAPRSNDGNAVGVAYKSDLLTIRAVEDVLISSSNERAGVRDALKYAGDRNVKIISMSIGSVTSSSTVKDGIYYAYNRGKLIIAAAGTSFSWTSWWGVIFPANMSQTTAVTGVKEGSSLNRCNTCHDGSKVDFAITMQRNFDNDRTSLALALYSNQPKQISGSSTATAMTAGIAALVWSENPSASRTTVLNAMKNASQFYPSRDSNFGWGRIDASAAVNGM